MTTVRRKTAPRTISRCHQGIVNPVLVERQGFPAGEALLEAVPEADLVLAEVPAEQHLLVAAKSRKVDQAAVEVLYEHAEPLEALHAFGDRLALTLELLLERPRLLRVEVAAVAGDPLGELRPPRRGRGRGGRGAGGAPPPRPRGGGRGGGGGGGAPRRPGAPLRDGRWPRRE